MNENKVNENENKVNENENKVNENTERNEEEFDLTELFARLQWLFHRYHLQNHNQFGPMADPTKGQGRVLAILKMKPEISQKDLSYLLDMRPQSLGELLSKLEKNGYITRTPSDTDRRVMNIKLTKEGTEATIQEFSFDRLFVCLNEAEQRKLSDYLNRIIESLEAQLGEEQSEHEFEPRRHGVNPFEGPVSGHPDWEGSRGFQGDGQFDPRIEMARRFGMMPFGRRPGIGRRYGEDTDQKQNKTDEE